MHRGHSAGLRGATVGDRDLVERKFRLTALVRSGAFTQRPSGLRRTLTWDQSNEMFHHQRIEQQTGLKIYFADPHSPRQRGSNENVNDLLRQRAAG